MIYIYRYVLANCCVKLLCGRIGALKTWEWFVVYVVKMLKLP